MMEIYADNWSISVLLRAIKLWYDKYCENLPTSLAVFMGFLRFAYWLVSATWCMCDLLAGNKLAGDFINFREHPPSACRLYFGTQYFDQVARTLEISEEDIKSSREISNNSISRIYTSYDIFSTLAAHLNDSIDDAIPYVRRYSLEESVKNFAKWSPYCFLPESLINENLSLIFLEKRQAEFWARDSSLPKDDLG